MIAEAEHRPASGLGQLCDMPFTMERSAHRKMDKVIKKIVFVDGHGEEWASCSMLTRVSIGFENECR